MLNTFESMLSQTLLLFGVDLSKFAILTRMLKGCFNLNPPRARYSYTWDVSIVLKYLVTLYPLEDLSLKLLTLKLVSLVALTTAARAQTLAALNLEYMSSYDGQKTFVFHIQELMKTTRPGYGLPSVLLKQFNTPELCVVRTLIHYILRTKDVR